MWENWEENMVLAIQTITFLQPMCPLIESTPSSPQIPVQHLAGVRLIYHCPTPFPHFSATNSSLNHLGRMKDQNSRSTWLHLVAKSHLLLNFQLFFPSYLRTNQNLSKPQWIAHSISNPIWITFTYYIKSITIPLSLLKSHSNPTKIQGVSHFPINIQFDMQFSNDLPIQNRLNVPKISISPPPAPWAAHPKTPTATPSSAPASPKRRASAPCWASAHRLRRDCACAPRGRLWSWRRPWVPKNEEKTGGNWGSPENMPMISHEMVGCSILSPCSSHMIPNKMSGDRGMEKNGEMLERIGGKHGQKNRMVRGNSMEKHGKTIHVCNGNSMEMVSG